MSVKLPIAVIIPVQSMSNASINSQVINGTRCVVQPFQNASESHKHEGECVFFHESCICFTDSCICFPTTCYDAAKYLFSSLLVANTIIRSDLDLSHPGNELLNSSFFHRESRWKRTQTHKFVPQWNCRMLHKTGSSSFSGPGGVVSKKITHLATADNLQDIFQSLSSCNLHHCWRTVRWPWSVAWLANRPSCKSVRSVFVLPQLPTPQQQKIIRRLKTRKESIACKTLSPLWGMLSSETLCSLSLVKNGSTNEFDHFSSLQAFRPWKWHGWSATFQNQEHWTPPVTFLQHNCADKHHDFMIAAQCVLTTGDCRTYCLEEGAKCFILTHQNEIKIWRRKNMSIVWHFKLHRRNGLFLWDPLFHLHLGFLGAGAGAVSVASPPADRVVLAVWSRVFLRRRGGVLRG